MAGSETAFASSEETMCTVSDGHLVPAIRVALKTMKKGERAVLKVKPACELRSEELQVPGVQGRFWT